MSSKKSFVGYRIHRTSLVLTLAAAFLLLQCQKVESLYSPREWLDLLKSAGGWIPLPVPDSKYKPGAIIQVNESGVRWIGHFDSCGCPEKVLKPEPGKIPALKFTKSIGLNANALVNLKGISAGPQFEQMSMVSMDIAEHSAPALKIIDLKVWLERPDNRKAADPCLEELLKPDRYLVTEAFMVSKGKYTLHDKAGAVIKLDLANLAKFLKFSPDVKVQITTDGSLEIDEPAYFALRKAQRVGDDWQFLGEPEKVESADARIEEIYLKQTAR